MASNSGRSSRRTYNTPPADGATGSSSGSGWRSKGPTNRGFTEVPEADLEPIEQATEDTAPPEAEEEKTSAPSDRGAPSSPRAYTRHDRLPPPKRDAIVVNPLAMPRETTPGAGRGEVLFHRQSPSLLVETLGPRRVIIGREAQYKVLLRNVGEMLAEDVEVSIKAPDWADVVDTHATAGLARTATAAGESVHWAVDKLAAQGREEITIKLVPRKSHTFELGVQWSCAPASSLVSVEVQEPKLQLNVTGPGEVEYGEKVVYELTFENPGTADAEKVLVRLLPLDPADEPDAHEIGTIAAGQKKVVEIELIARQSGQLAIRAEATAEGGLRSAASKDVIVRRAGIRVALEGPKFRYARTACTYLVRVSNPGNAPARDVQVGVMLPRKAKFVSTTGGGRKDQDNNIRWTIGKLDPAGEQTYEVKCELEQTGPNRLQVAAVARGDLRDTNFVTTEVEALADLDLDVRDPKSPVPVGEDVAYEIVVRNRGTKSAPNIELQAYFSEGVEAVSVEGIEHKIEPGKVTLRPIDNLAAGAELTVKIVARAKSAVTTCSAPSCVVKPWTQHSPSRKPRDSTAKTAKSGPAGERNRPTPRPTRRFTSRSPRRSSRSASSQHRLRVTRSRRGELSRGVSLAPESIALVTSNVVQPGGADGYPGSQAVIVPHRGPRQCLLLFEQGQPGGVIAFGLGLAQCIQRLQQRQQQGLQQATRSHRPGGHAIDAGVEKVQADPHAGQEIAAHQLLCDGLQFVRQRDNVVAVPAHAAADV